MNRFSSVSVLGSLVCLALAVFTSLASDAGVSIADAEASRLYGAACAQHGTTPVDECSESCGTTRINQIISGGNTHQSDAVPCKNVQSCTAPLSVEGNCST